MTIRELQRWLADRGQFVVIDGVCGQQTRNAIMAAFVNPEPAKVTDDEIDEFARRLGCSTRQLRAVARVESGGNAFDRAGRPKILYERHIFWRLTNGRHGKSAFSDPSSGGYREDSWGKLTQAACHDVDVAFSSASFGRFQIMGMHWRNLGYGSPLDLAYSIVSGEPAHYEMLVRFLELNNLKPALRRLSVRPTDNRAFALGYNGPAFDRLGYDAKLARAMQEV